ncbi:MAG TPA: glycosyltransferase [Candidatus Limnocylindria bacterium]|nr:glycosyltransferase [Candidatus Limnocylindria bacterium]
MNPRVTIILTIYNRTDFLPGALESALRQTMTDFEIIVADDSGQGIAGPICDSFHLPEKIRHQANPKNIGIALSLQMALKSARGDYFAILNDDDLWDPDFLASLVPPLDQNPSAVVAFCDHWIVGPDAQRDLAATEDNTRRFGRAGLREGLVSHPAAFVIEKNGVPLAMAALIRRKAVDPAVIVPEVTGAYDFWISCQLAAAGGGFYYVPKRLTLYRVHPAMETARRRPNGFANHFYIYSQLLDSKRFPAPESCLKRRLGESLLLLGRDHLYYNLLPDARGFLRRSLAQAPTLRALAGWVISYFPKSLRIRLGLSVA